MRYVGIFLGVSGCNGNLPLSLPSKATTFDQTADDLLEVECSSRLQRSVVSMLLALLYRRKHLRIAPASGVPW